MRERVRVGEREKSKKLIVSLERKGQRRRIWRKSHLLEFHHGEGNMEKNSNSDRKHEQVGNFNET